ncbi:hypothetical protein BDB01DRAFT_783845 [Pilobolus umbonatus]|nr:hypothetical protein BDB01DRAFT_783845 [Pilobolus umbonatus]
MVDVVGFSTLTTIAANKGESGAEAIALEIGSYMGECIEIIEYYGGDVVKFLGDAVLVSFQSIEGSDQGESSNEETSSTGEEERHKHLLVKKGVECGLQLLARLSHYRVYLTAEERTKHRGLSEDSSTIEFNTLHPYSRDASVASVYVSEAEKSQMKRPTVKPKNIFGNWDCIPNFMKKKDHGSRRASEASEPSTLNSDLTNAIDLELHMALSCGNVTNIVLGDANIDASVETRIANNLEKTGTPSSAVVDNNFSQYNGRLEYAIAGEVVESLGDALSTAKAGEMAITLVAYSIIQEQQMQLSFEKRRNFFILSNESITPRKKPSFGASSLRRYSGSTIRKVNSMSINSEYLKMLPGLEASDNKLEISPLIPKVRNYSFMSISSSENTYYHKYLNRSGLFRLYTSLDDTYTAQFREVTIMFISLGKTDATSKEGLNRLEIALKLVIQSLIKYEGMLQQFAIDDKGATILCVFGLPPLSHECEPMFAVKAAFDIKQNYINHGFRGFAISLSTGNIFTAVLPQNNPYRRDTSIAGDAIVLAVRMLKFSFSKENVVCDAATKNQIHSTCEFEDYGENFVKGKVNPVPIYGIKRCSTSKLDPNLSTKGFDKDITFIGYKYELKEVTDFLHDWYNGSNYHMLVISGPSGAGKSFLCKKIHQKMQSNGFISCFSSSAEVEKGSKFYLIRNLVLSLLETIDSDKIPEKDGNTHEASTAPSVHSLIPCCPTPIKLAATANILMNPTSLATYLKLGRAPLTGSSSRSPHSSERGSPIVRGKGSPSVKNRDSPNVMNRNSPSARTRNSSSIKGKGSSNLASPTPSSPFSSKNNTAIGCDLSALIKRCLCKCGEQEDYMPLFKIFFHTMRDVEENKYTHSLDGQAVDILLTGLLTRMIRYASSYVGIVFVCDDIQWADLSSIHILQHFHENCRNLMLLIATRPENDFDLSFLDESRTVGTFEQVKLNGLDTAEIGEILLQSFPGVHKINMNMLKMIQKRTGGNPLHVKNMAIVLKDFNHVTIVEDELVPSSNFYDLEDLVGNFDYKRIIRMQFDRLNTNFQDFLIVASFLDQYFTTLEIQAVVKANNTIFHHNDPDEIRRIIKDYDVYHFLQQVEAENYSGYTNDSYTFCHITIPQSIYAMISFETRISLHKALAKYYESLLLEGSYTQLLGKITRHYLETDIVPKQLYYLELLADENIKSNSLPEATSNLEKIVHILDSDVNYLNEFGQLKLSDIYRRLGVCYTKRTKLKEGEHYLFKSLECLGQPWPNTKVKFFIKLYKNQFIQYQHRKGRKFAAYSKSILKEHCYRVVDIMKQLSSIYYFTGNGGGFIYSCLAGLNACEYLEGKVSTYSAFLAQNALICWLNEETELSVYYITKALKETDDERPDSETLTTCATLSFAAGRFKNSRDLIYRSIKSTRTLGEVTDCQLFYQSVKLLVTLSIFEGTFNRSSSDVVYMKQMADTANGNGDSEAEVWLGVYHISSSLILDRLINCAPYVSLLEAHINGSAYYNLIAIHGVLMCYYSRSHNFDVAKRHFQRILNLLPLLKSTPNIFPLYGLIFSTMGLLVLIEHKQIEYTELEDYRGYEKFMKDISCINHAYQRVKYWEFVQPCLYITRALPYIASGRVVEGYTVLRHGVFEMKFLQEIKFMKAYYWACLGKFAFAPEDRKEWTNRAKEDFHALNIPHDIYCNPDPEAMYCRNYVADVRVSTSITDLPNSMIHLNEDIKSSTRRLT